MTSPAPALGPDALARRNANVFVAFRVLFNSRFYYPIFAVLFLDFGLTLEQFAILNAVWAASIVVFEVPSGALADKLGRRRLVIFSAWLMLVEMTVLCVTPVGGPWVFPVFLLNRVISGLAEACCSGADEALVYDVLPQESRNTAWTRVLSSLMKWQSLGFMLVALTGAATYDPGFMNRLSAFIGAGEPFNRAICLRIPLVLNWCLAVATVVVSWRFIDTHPVTTGGNSLGALVRLSFRQMLETARWILRTPAATVIILTGLLYDSSMRLFYTIGSNYYRLLGIPEGMNGVILAGSSLMGIGTAFVVERLVGRLKPSQNLGIVAFFILTGLTGISHALPGWTGVLFVIPFWLGMRSLHYFVSQYLNRVSESHNRATVLSFKGLTMNLAYGAVMLGYQFQTASLRQSAAGDLAALGKEARDTHLLALAMPSWPWIFAILAAALALWVRLRYRTGLTGLLQREKE